jgi:hypothetical protein
LAQFTYIGDELGTDAYGLLFPAGVAVEVTQPHAINKLRGNRFFAEVFEGVEVIEATPTPKRRGRPPKAE